MSLISLILTQKTVTSDDHIVGGFSAVDLNSLSPEVQQADQYLRDRHPELDGAVITDVEQQVVAGMNYDIAYQKNTNGQIETW